MTEKASAPISVVIPVGPLPQHRRWLDECFASVLPQLGSTDELFIVDDFACLRPSDLPPNVTHYRNPWRLGLVASFNIGVMASRNDLVIILGSDDKLLPGALDCCRAAWATVADPLLYYTLDVMYDSGEMQTIACQAAMVTKTLWRWSGGLPPESAVGAPDTMFLAILNRHGRAVSYTRRVPSPAPLYWVRRHGGQDTASRGPWQGVIFETRRILTDGWTPPKWTTNDGP